jgi:hypothetical protein
VKTISDLYQSMKAEERRKDLLHEVAQAIAQSDYVESGRVVNVDDFEGLTRVAYYGNAEAVLSLFEAKGFALADLDDLREEGNVLRGLLKVLEQEKADLLAELRERQAYIDQLMYGPPATVTLKSATTTVELGPESVKLLKSLVPPRLDYRIGSGFGSGVTPC